MRIISQDKRIDIAYERAVVYIHRTTHDQSYVIAHVPDEDFSLGAYDTAEDAAYVMSLIRTAFSEEYRYFYMPEARSLCY
jgi:hypothetical protein